MTILSKIELYSPVTADGIDFLGGGLVPFLIASSDSSSYFFQAIAIFLNQQFLRCRIQEIMVIHFGLNEIFDSDISSIARVTD